MNGKWRFEWIDDNATFGLSGADPYSMFIIRRNFDVEHFSRNRELKFMIKAKFWSTFSSFPNFFWQVDLEPELHIHSNLDADGSETIPLSEDIVNPGRIKLGPQDFELKKVLGKGGYGKVFQVSIWRHLAANSC